MSSGNSLCIVQVVFEYYKIFCIATLHADVPNVSPIDCIRDQLLSTILDDDLTNFIIMNYQCTK